MSLSLTALSKKTAWFEKALEESAACVCIGAAAHKQPSLSAKIRLQDASLNLATDTQQF